MRKVRSFINVVLGSLVAVLSLNSCETQHVVLEKYGVPDVDTTVHCMYGVPAPQINWNGETDTDNENKQ